MNCTSCGAAMHLVDQRDYYACDYCGSFRFPNEPADAVDLVKALGAPSETRCPVCDVPLTEATIEKFRVLHCERCRGVLATNGTFADVVRTLRLKRGGATNAPTPLNPEELDRRLHCPGCGGSLETHPYYGPGNVVVDTCFRCTLIWLDHGELGRIHRAPGSVWGEDDAPRSSEGIRTPQRVDVAPSRGRPTDFITSILDEILFDGPR